MDEELWLTGTDPLALLAALHPVRTLGSVQPQTRQSRLYLLACARRQWGRLPLTARTLVALAEVVADSPRAKESLRAACAPVAADLMHSDGEPRDFRSAEDELTAAGFAADLTLARRASRKGVAQEPVPASDEWRALGTLIYLAFEQHTPNFHWLPAELHSLDLLHEVYGNPFRGVPFEPAWRTSTVLGVARQIYALGDFSAMPILADALQDAGCDDDDILGHCRDASLAHVRGCWVLDLVLKLR